MAIGLLSWLLLLLAILLWAILRHIQMNYDCP